MEESTVALLTAFASSFWVVFSKIFCACSWAVFVALLFAWSMSPLKASESSCLASFMLGSVGLACDCSFGCDFSLPSLTAFPTSVQAHFVKFPSDFSAVSCAAFCWSFIQPTKLSRSVLGAGLAEAWAAFGLRACITMSPKSKGFLGAAPSAEAFCCSSCCLCSDPGAGAAGVDSRLFAALASPCCFTQSQAPAMAFSQSGGLSAPAACWIASPAPPTESREVEEPLRPSSFLARSAEAAWKRLALPRRMTKTPARAILQTDANGKVVVGVVAR
mmetsp:Transcript_47520/g.137263  ORF Transcript_47520/g.137263 Transcript_47520/m.137263 type:complete len:274 (+) Transcript_47520:1645-2466(+)